MSFYVFYEFFFFVFFFVKYVWPKSIFFMWIVFLVLLIDMFTTVRLSKNDKWIAREFFDNRAHKVLNKLKFCFWRLATFHLLLARLDSVSGKFHDALAHLHAVHYILNSRNSKVAEGSTENSESKDEAEDIKKDTGNTDGKSESSSGGLFEIKSKPLDYEDHLGMIGMFCLDDETQM